MKVSEVNEIVTAKVLEALANGVAPWQQPWVSGLPMSMSTNKPYRGINTLILGLQAMKMEYSSTWWGTFNQVAKLSGFVETPRKNGKGTWWKAPDDDPDRRIFKGDKGEQHGTVIYLWKLSKRVNPDFPDDRSKDIAWLYATTYRVYNYDQCASLPEKYAAGRHEVTGDEIPEAQAALDDYFSRGPGIRYGGGSAHYQMGLDLITVPSKETFKTIADFIATQAHESGHSTGHGKRLNRPGIEDFDHFGSQKYSKEELVAEMTAAMFCAYFGIDATFDNSAAYLGHWLSHIKGDKENLITTAARQAQRAFDLIMGITYENGDNGE